ncbi:MAG: PDZ domain-containing protein [Chlamydiales bacterium]|nr:PDZ domain-containing protein [Chlamydiales bacterium]
MIRYALFLLFFTVQAIYGSKLPEISDRDVVATLAQMMEAHASYKELSPSLVERVLEQYLEELDPTKTYLLEGEVEKWLRPTDETLQEVLSETQKGSFTAFNSIHNLMVEAVTRRAKLEKRIEEVELPENVSVNEFKELKWVKTEEELLERLMRIKALQVQATERLGDPDSRDRALQRIAKRRLSREEEIASKDAEERSRLIRSQILKAFAASFDTHTAYFTPGEASQFMIQVQQRLFGIGAQLRDDLNGFTIVKIIEGGPASRATGLKVNDRIIAINHEPVVGLEITEAVELIRGEEGTAVLLTVLRDENEKHEIEIIRGEVVIKEARIESSTIPYGDGVIAHISLHAFYQDPLHSSAADLYEEIAKIRSDHLIKGIILDLRLNSGGVLPQAVAVTGLFITKGIVVSIKDNHGAVEHLRDIDGKTAYDGPLIVLTSKLSASAAEIVAQTLQDYGRALVVGDEHTYGKGTFQTFTLDAGSNGKVNPKGEFKVTRGRYYTVSGKSPQLVGVKPDIVVPGFYSATEIGEMHAKYPLENDSIPENFHDDLSDIPVVQRDQISWLYRFNLQPKLKTYVRLLPQLKINSEERIAKNKLYQSFLAALQEEEVPPEKVDLYMEGDPQLSEAVNIMQDLIVLSK